MRQQPGGLEYPTFTHGSAERNNWGARQTTQPRVPVQEIKSSKPLAVKMHRGYGSRRDSQSLRRVFWRGPQDPRTYTSPPTWESAPKRHNPLVGSKGSDSDSGARAKQVT